MIAKFVRFLNKPLKLESKKKRPLSMGSFYSSEVPEKNVDENDESNQSRIGSQRENLSK